MSKKLNYRFNKYGTRKLYKFIYIFTEGEKTEVNYFESKTKEIEEDIRRKNIKIKIKGTAHNTTSLVDYAMEFIRKENIDLENDDCWVVFDKDDFDKDFDNAINKAEKAGIKVAYSNESFELWYLLHFSFLSSAISRKDYLGKLSDNLGIKYSKISEDIYSLIKDKEKDAIRNAKKLLDMHKNEKSFFKKNPSTTVHLLVEGLNGLKQC